VGELVAWGKANPDKANYASTSPAFIISTELLKLKSGMPGTMIPYKSSNEMVLSVMQGQTLLAISDGPPAIPQIKGGKVRALAVLSESRVPPLPEVPTAKEAGVDGFVVSLWYGMFAPARTPPDIVARLSREVIRALESAELRERLAAMGVDPWPGTPEELASLVRSETARYATLIKSMGLRLD